MIMKKQKWRKREKNQAERKISDQKVRYEALFSGSEFQIFTRRMQACMYAFYRPDFQKYSMLPEDQKTQTSICFKASDHDFKLLSETIG